eukprot:14882936-Alexandrium_andersonii.AAC.1
MSRCVLENRAISTEKLICESTTIIVGTVGTFARSAVQRELRLGKDARFRLIGVDEATRTLKFDLDMTF